MGNYRRGGGGADILVREGGVLSPHKAVFQGGGGAPYSGGTRGRAEAKRRGVCVCVGGGGGV